MPMLIRTPEDIFRTERRDLYALHFSEQDHATMEDTRKEMAGWFAHRMPASPTETMAPSEHSGFIEGGPTSLRIAFTAADLERFCAQWETADGQSIDPRFQCYQYPYQAWWDKHGHYQPTLAQPEAPGVSVWIECPLGILSHVLPPGSAQQHPAAALDLWANACQHWPELQAHNLDDLNFGKVVHIGEPRKWVLLWNAPFNSLFNLKDSHWRALADWLRLPADVEIGSEF